MQPFNKYYPPDWTPDKGSVNKFVGKHAYGDRARKIDQGILIVRFELPFNIWCTGCENHIGKGVRYNAEKKQIGKYYSTPILQFRMKCHLCDNWIEIHTDPKNAEYLVISGARKKVETWQPDKDDHMIILNNQDEELKEKLEEDPIFRLEHGIQDKMASTSKAPVLTQLQRLNDSQWKDPYTLSQQMRRKFREEKKKDQQIEAKANQLKDKHSLHIDLLPESEDDDLKAKLVDFTESHRSHIQQQKLEVSTAPLFNISSSSSSSLPSLIPTNKIKNHQNDTNHAKQILENRAKLHTKLKTDPFLQQNGFTKRKASSNFSSSNTTTLVNTTTALSPTSSSSFNDVVTLRPAKKVKSENTIKNLVNYNSSDSESDG